MKKPLVRTVSLVLFYYDSEGKRTEGMNPYLSGNCSELSGDCSELSGNCSGLSGNCSGLSGDCSGLSGNLDEIPLQSRGKHPDIEYWVKEAK